MSLLVVMMPVDVNLVVLMILNELQELAKQKGFIINLILSAV